MAKQDVIKALTSIKGIGEAKAEALYSAGFTTIEKIQQASSEDLCTVDGISESIATSIQEHLAIKKESSKARDLTKEKESTPSPSEVKLKKEGHSKPKKGEPSKTTPSSSGAKKQEAAETEEEGRESGAEVSDYEVKKKPILSAELKEKIRIRSQIKQRTPTFLREEWFRYKRIAKNWRRPDGLHSKMRMNMKYRPSKVRVGFRGPKETRGLHPSGFEEIMVYTVNDLASIDPKTQAARIGGTVGSRKRQAIIEKAKELDIRLLNK